MIKAVWYKFSKSETYRNMLMATAANGILVEVTFADFFRHNTGCYI
jgi:predicted NAD-dependent protein-ADP-ribosyltransferase YbiA (DUF1768 family)